MLEAFVSKQQIKPLANLPCKNPRTPQLFLYVLMIVSQICVVRAEMSVDDSRVDQAMFVSSYCLDKWSVFR